MFDFLKRRFSRPDPGAGPATVETSAGRITLTGQQQAVLARLLSGAASAAEGESLYEAVSARRSAFPIEWEVHVLRAQLAAAPDREDLVARLAIVEETLSPGPLSGSAARLDFERAWVRFTRADLLGGGEPALAAALDDASLILGSPVFNTLRVARRVEVFAALHGTLMSVPSRHLPIIAELGMRRFVDMLEEPDLTEPQACAVYDVLHSFYFAGVSDVRELRRFDRIAPLFEAWLEARHGRKEPPAMAYPARPLRIGYLFHTAHLERGNAVTPLMLSLAEMHSAREAREITIYAAQYVADGFRAEMERRGLAVREFRQDARYDRIDEVANQIRTDGIDILFTEQNRALAAALFVRRVAPRQLWIDTGFPFWTLRALDWTLSPSADPDDPPPRTSPLIWRQVAETLAAPVDASAVAAQRAELPRDSFALGVFARLIKLDRNFLDVLRRIVGADPRFHLVIAGPGDAREIEAFVGRPELAGRITFRPGSVDLNVYGPAIDLMCDTFPFIGGNACREVAVHGTPVLSKLGTPWDAVLRADRNPELLARTEDEYVALALRMLNDPEFRERQRRVTREIAAEYTNPGVMLDDIEAAIAAAITRLSS